MTFALVDEHSREVALKLLSQTHKGRLNGTAGWDQKKMVPPIKRGFSDERG